MNGKRFDVPTHIYGHQLDSYELELLNTIYKIEDVDYVVWGKMKNGIFQKLINCLKTSASVKRKYKRLLA